MRPAVLAVGDHRTMFLALNFGTEATMSSRSWERDAGVGKSFLFTKMTQRSPETGCRRACRRSWLPSSERAM
jgi:hypothetical protein